MNLLQYFLYVYTYKCSAFSMQVHSACPLVGVLLCELSFELHRGRNAENSGQLGNSMGGDQACKEEQHVHMAKMWS